MSTNISEIFGVPDKAPDKNVSLAMLLRLLLDLIDKEEKPEQKPDRSEGEIPVRPRIEPCGGP